MSKDKERPRDESSRLQPRNQLEEGLVERLLNAAGPGPEIPEGGAERIKTAIRPTWRDEVAVGARQRRRLWAGGLAAAAAVIIAVIVIPALQQGQVETRSDGIVPALIDGGLEITPPGSTVSFLGPDDTGSIIPDGSLVRTRRGHRAALRLTGGQSLRLDDDTVIRLDSERSISLDSGAVYISSAGGAGAGVEVRTALGTATEIGTQFEVRIELGSLDVKVREGLVSLSRDADDYQIANGIRLSVDAAGVVTTSSISAYDPAWAWTQEIAPAFDIEGRSALAFLDWVSSETGLAVRFASAEVEHSAATTLLHGTIAGLSPADTPAAVLPTCGLTAIEETGALLVLSLSSEESHPSPSSLEQ